MSLRFINRDKSTELDEHDRLILNQYKDVYTNFIESSTAEMDNLEDKKQNT